MQRARSEMRARQEASAARTHNAPPHERGRYLGRRQASVIVAIVSIEDEMCHVCPALVAAIST